MTSTVRTTATILLLLSTQPFRLISDTGEVVRVAPGELSYSSANSWKDIYGQRKSGNVFTKDPRFLVTDDT